MDANQVGFVHELTLGRHQDGARQRHHHQAAAADVGAVLGRRADAVAVLPRRRPLRAQGRLQLACRRRPTASSSPRAPSSPRRRPKPACATPTCSSTASATPPTRTAASATCSTSSCAPSRTCTTPASTSSRSSPSSTASTTSRSAASSSSRSTTRRRSTSCRSSRCRFTGRDEEVTDERRAAQRYTLSHLAHDVKNQTGLGEPIRDWFPISFMGTFTDWADVVHGAGQRVGPAHLRLPPELRHRHGGDDRQGNQGSGAGHRVPQGRAAGQGRRAGQRRRARQVPVGRRHGAGAGAQLRPVQVADALQADRTC